MVVLFCACGLHKVADVALSLGKPCSCGKESLEDWVQGFLKGLGFGVRRGRQGRGVCHGNRRGVFKGGILGKYKMFYL